MNAFVYLECLAIIDQRHQACQHFFDFLQLVVGDATLFILVE